jgi:hypothetical protein
MVQNREGLVDRAFGIAEVFRRESSGSPCRGDAPESFALISVMASG